MKKNILSIWALMVLLSLTCTEISLAAEWKQDNTGWKYQNDDGTYTSSKWHEIDGKQYYFDNNGYMLKNTTTPDGHQVDSDGVWIQDMTTNRSINYDIVALYATDINSTYGELKNRYGESSSYYPSGVYFLNSPLNARRHYDENDAMYSIDVELGFDIIHSYYYFKPDYGNLQIIKDEDKPIHIMVDSEQLFTDFPWLELAEGTVRSVGEEASVINNPREGRTVDDIRELLKSYGITNLKVLDKKIYFNWRKYDDTSGTTYTHPTIIRVSITDGFHFYLYGENGTLYFPRMLEVYPEINSEKEKDFDESEYSKDQYWGEILIH